MTAATCATCKHWYTADRDQIQITGRGLCLMTTTVTRPDGEMTRGREDSKATATTVVVSTFGYRLALGQLETADDFGCNQWEDGQ